MDGEKIAFKLNADRALNKIIFSLRIFGLWKPQPRTKAYDIYSTVYFIICPGLLNVLMFIFLLNLEDQSDLTSTLYMLLTQLCGGIKSLWFLMRNREFQQLAQRSKSFILESVSEQKLVVKRMKFFVFVTSFYAASALSALHTTEIGAFVSKNRKLPFTVWYPFLDWKNSVRDYWIAVTYTHVAIISASILIVAVDILLCLLLFIVSIELELIGKRLSQLGYSEKEEKTPKNRLNQINVEIEFLNVMKNCVNCHNEALFFKCTLEKCFSLPFFFQIVFSGIIISSIINEVAKDSQLAMPYCLATIALVVQIFLPCYFANKVISRSSILSMRAYESNWIEMTISKRRHIKFKKCFFILFERLKRDTQVTIGMVFPLSLTTFTSIVNVAYRLFTVL